jgi:hypothetical protein
MNEWPDAKAVALEARRASAQRIAQLERERDEGIRREQYLSHVIDILAPDPLILSMAHAYAARKMWEAS